MEIKDNKSKMGIFKKFFSILMCIVFVMLFCGASYALWNFEFEGEFNVLDASSITMELLESDEVISLDNAIPISDELGKLGETFDFMVRTETSATMSIGYNIVLEKQEAPEGYSLFNDDEIKIYLTDEDGNALLEPTLVSEISGNYVMYKKLNVHNSEIREIKDNYKLRVWIDEDVTSDRINENTNLLYKFKLGVKTSIDSSSNSTYKVTYNANGGEGVMSDSTFTFNELEELSSNTFVRPYYNFLGWSLKPNGEVIYNDGEEVSNITDVYNGKVNLYAVWEKVKYRTSVVVQNGTLTGDSSLLVPHAENGVFNLSSSQGTDAIVSCTNGQAGVFDNYVLTVKNVLDNTVCTVNFVPSSTVLYTDGTFIINEKGSDRESNMALHGAVVKEYEPFSATQSYVFNSPLSLWNDEINDIKDVYIGQKISPTDTKYWFNDCHNMKSGDFTNLDTSLVTSMNFMFDNAGDNSNVESFTLIGLENWDTSNVLDMKFMFSNIGKRANEWNIGDISNWNVSNVTNMSYMFSGAGSEADSFYVDLSEWDVSSVVFMNSIFDSTGNQSQQFYIGNLSSWDVSKVVGMNEMFYNAGSMAEEVNIGNLAEWDVSEVIDMTKMFSSFASNSSNFSFDLSNWDVSSVTNMQGMFERTGRNSLNWSVGDLSNWNVSKVTDMSYMFEYAGGKNIQFNLEGISDWDVSKVTNMERFFGNYGEFVTEFVLDLSNWDVSKVTDMNGMFISCGRNATSWSIGDISDWDVSSVIDMVVMFKEAGYNSNVFELNLSGWNSHNVLDIGQMFEHTGYNSDVFKINLSSMDVSKVENFGSMFQYSGYSASEWRVGDLSSWDTSSAVDMGDMFYYAGGKDTRFSLGGISSWDVSGVTKMDRFFLGFGEQVTDFVLDLSNWDTSSVTDMSYMFSSAAKNATTWSIGDLSSWDVSNVTMMSDMFRMAGYNSDTFELNLSGWDLSGVTSMFFAFAEAGYNSDVFRVNVSNVNVSNVTSFKNTFESTGYNATVWNISGLSNWDTSSATEMFKMFANAGYRANYTLDLSGWEVPLVTSYADFNVGVTDKITSPVWVN